MGNLVEKHAPTQVLFIPPFPSSAHPELDFCLYLIPYFDMESIEALEYLSLIDFVVNCYAYVTACNVYPDQSALQSCFFNRCMVVWRQPFLKEQEEEEHRKSSLS